MRHKARALPVALHHAHFALRQGAYIAARIRALERRVRVVLTIQVELAIAARAVEVEAQGHAI